MLRNCSSDVAYESTSPASLKFVRQSDSESQIRMPAPFLCHLARSSFSATRDTLFLEWPGQRVALFRPLLCFEHIALFVYQDRSFLSLVKSLQKGLHTMVRFRNAQAHPKVICGLWNQRPSWNPPSRSTFWHTTPGNSARWSSIPPSGQASGIVAWTHPGLLVANDRVSGTTYCIKTSKRACKALAECILACSFLPLPHLPFLWITFMRILRKVVGVQSSCFSISLKICLVISFVFSLHASMSSTRTPLQSLALPFFPSCRLQPAPHFWELQNLIYLVLVHLSSQTYVLFVSAVIILYIVISLLVVQLAVEVSEDVGNSFPRCHRFSFFILRFEDECLFSLRIWSMICSWYHWTSQGSAVPLLSFLLLFLILLNTSFNCCLSSLAVVLFSLMSLLISSSLHSVFFASASCCSFIRASFRLSLLFCCFCFLLFLCFYRGFCVCIRRCCFSFGTSFSVCLCLYGFISFLLLCGCCGFCAVLSWHCIQVHHIARRSDFFPHAFLFHCLGSCCTHSFLSPYLQSDSSKVFFCPALWSQTSPSHVQLLHVTFREMYVACFSVVFLYIVLTAQTSVASSIASSNLLSCFRHWEYIGKHCFAQGPMPRPNSALKSPPTIWKYFFDLVCFSIALYAFSTWWSAYPEWECTHSSTVQAGCWRLLTMQ